VTYMNLNLEKERDLILEKIKIKKIRDNLGFSRTKLAQIIGISDKSIYRWEHEVNIKLLDTLTREDAKKWLNTPNRALSSRTPVKTIFSADTPEQGVQIIIDLLTNMESGVFT